MTNIRPRDVAATALLLLWPTLSSPAGAQSPRNVLVVVNAASADSVQIGKYYARKRQIPEGQVLRLTTLPADPADGIDRPEFDRAISAPISAWLSRNQAQDRILYIVLTKGIPLRINGGAQQSSAASVDSELSLLYLRMTGAKVETLGPLSNPYFLGARSIAEAKPFTRDAYSMYLVTRLDGFTVQDVFGLIDRGIAPSRDGRFVLDEKVAWTDRGNVWLREAAARLKASGISADRIVLDETSKAVTDQADVLGYFSWGSNDPAIRQRHFGMKFQPGAIGGMFVSTDGRTFREPPEKWAVANWADPTTWFAGSPQSLTGDLIREGITGVAGHVAEPLLGNTIRPDILFPAYVSGFSLAESFYLAMPSVSWMTVVVGDPLCAPFATASTKRIEDPPIDPATELPALFSQRRLDAAGDTTVPLDVQKRLLRAASRTDRGDQAGARADLELATDAVPTLLTAQLLLALNYDAAGDYDSAIARYRTLLAQAPDTTVALNNLAYSLAVRKGQLSDALPLADRARTLAPQSGVIADTLGWIYFMSGDRGRALPLLSEAAQLEPAVAEIRLHLALAQAAAGNRAAAREQAAQAVRLDPSLQDRKDVRALLKAR